jgi:hypothetical protein
MQFRVGYKIEQRNCKTQNDKKRVIDMAMITFYNAIWVCCSFAE